MTAIKGMKRHTEHELSILLLKYRYDPITGKLFGKKGKETAKCTNNTGYHILEIGNILYKAHRVAWILFRDEIPDGVLVLHRCDNPACIRPSHLFRGDYMANRIDMLSKGRGITSRKITSGMATVIRREYLAGYSSGELATRFRLSKSHIGNVLTGAISGDRIINCCEKSHGSLHVGHLG